VFPTILPLAKSGLTTAGVLMFLLNWNEFYYANALVVVIPGIIIYSVASRQVQASLASTAVKG
jgi:raffinose/stachyose/melibiose transport system permease protein